MSTMKLPGTLSMASVDGRPSARALWTETQGFKAGSLEGRLSRRQAL